MDVSVYVDYVNDNIDEIAEYVNEQFIKRKDIIRGKIIHEIRSYITPIPEHFVLKKFRNTYDCSGELFEDGLISVNQTVNEFLENEYTGSREATYTSGMGWRYLTYSDKLRYYILDFAAEIMFPYIKKYIEQHFREELSEEKYELIKFKCGEFDEIYDNCLASDFFFCYPLIDFLGIGEIKLSNIIRR